VASGGTGAVCPGFDTMSSFDAAPGSASSPQTRLRLLAAHLVASDPGGLARRRASRGTLSFLLTLLLIWVASLIVHQPVMTMALGFPVSIFACVVVKEQDKTARLIATLGLVAASGLSFAASALITNAWVNHAAFVALVFAVVYARRWGSLWSAIGFGVFVSFFFGAFLAPPPAALPLHLLGLLFAAVAALLIQFVVLPHDAAAALDRAMSAIRQRLALLLVPLERFCAARRWRDQDMQTLRSQLDLLKISIATAKAQLDATDGGWRNSTDLSFHLFEVEAAAERLVRLATHEGEGAANPRTRRRASALRAWLMKGARKPLVLPRAHGVLGEAMEELHDSVVRLRESRARGQTEGAAVADDGRGQRTPEKQHGLSPNLRLAIQASAACALAVIGGELLSSKRWYWALITAFVMFANTSSRGDALFKSIERVIGTFAGVLVGSALVWLVGGHWFLELALLPATIFLTFYFFTDRYSVMVFFLTLMLALLYSLLHRFSIGVLWLRLGETAVGATAGILVSSLLLPRATRSHVRESLLGLIEATSALVDAAVERLATGDGRLLATHNRDFDAAYAAMRDAIRPLWLDRFGGGAELHDAVGEGLRSCSYWVHQLGLASRGGDRPATDAAGQALRWHRDRLQRRLDRLRQRVNAGETQSGGDRDGDPASGRPPRSADERFDTAMRALRSISAAFNHIGDAVVAGGHRVPFFRY
jgi:uncharacterized membrane protein YccC